MRQWGLAVAAALVVITACASPRAVPPFEELAPRELVLREAAVEVPLDLSRRVPLVMARVEGYGPFLFLIDTGAPFSSVTPDLAARLGLEPAGLHVADPRGALTTVRVPSLVLGPSNVGSVELVGMTVVLSESGNTYGADGVLGFNSFLDCTVTFDFPRARLRVSRERLSGAPDGRELIADVGPLHRPTVEVEFEYGTGGRWRVPFLLDTGSDSGIFLPAEADALPFANERVGELEVATAYGPAHWELVRLEATVRLGELELARPVVTMRPRGPSVFPAQVGLLGMRLLARYRITFDARAGLVRLELDGR